MTVSATNRLGEGLPSDPVITGMDDKLVGVLWSKVIMCHVGMVVYTGQYAYTEE